MQINNVSLSALRAFCEVAQCLSFTVAARRLFRSQPALSRQVADMERELGLLLFVRQGRALSLTPAGHDLLGRARAILGDIDAFADRARAMASGSVGVLRVGATPMLFDNIMPRLLHEYGRKWNRVALKVVEEKSSNVIAQVESRELDVALTRYVTTDEIAAERLFPMHLVAIVRRGHALARRRVLEVSELQEIPLLLMAQGIGSRVLIDQTCRLDGYRLRDIRFESHSYGSLVAMAMAGYGVAVVSSVVSLQHEDARVIPVAHRGARLGTWAAIHWHRRTELPAYMQEFINIALRLSHSDYPGRHYGFPDLPD